jgi:lipid-A-disaccharide synthase
MLVAGEASGDRHAADLFNNLRQLIPDIRGIGMGGGQMRASGIDIQVDSTRLGVIGLAEVIRHYPEISRALATLRTLLRQKRPDLLICVDYKEFNFRLARTARSLGIKVLFYVSPQVWAWRPGRVRSYGRIIDHMAVIFPFEVPFYQKHHIPVTFVGHPLVGKVKANLPRNDACNQFGLSRLLPVVGLLPGSRTQEVRQLLPVMLESAVRLARAHDGLQFVLFRAPTIADSLLQAELARHPVRVKVIEGQNYDALNCCDAVISTSGTATLEVALMGVPLCIIYRLSGLSYWLGRLLVRIDWIGLPNILAGRSIVREFIQHKANPDNIAGEIDRILRDNRYADNMREELRRVRELLGPPEAAVKLAALARDLLGEKVSP